MTRRQAVTGLYCAILGMTIWIAGSMGQVPIDPDFAYQWGLANVGQEVLGVEGAPGADISALEAWNGFEPATDVVVAIVGAGVNPHPEFADRLLPGYVTPHAGGDPYSTLDTTGEGTRIAGIIAARRDDGVGVAGLNDRAWILPVRAISGTTGTLQSVAEGIGWAVDAGAAIILVPLQAYESSDALSDAVQHAFESGVLVIAPTGDIPGLGVALPAALEPSLAIASTDNQDQPADFSNSGPEVDLAAPGVGIWSTQADGGYGFETAPSSVWAAAYAAGVASLIRSQAPELSALNVAQILRDSADDDADFPGWDEHRGWGRLNAGEAFRRTLRPSIRFVHDQAVAAFFDANVPATLMAHIVDAAESVVSDSVTAVVRHSGGQETHHAMISIGDDRFLAVLPPHACEESIEFYFTAEGNRGSLVFDPWRAPSEVYSATIARHRTLLNDDFEVDLGWTAVTEGVGTTGAWVRAVPVGTTAQPGYDFSPDAGTRCFITGQHVAGNAGTNDVDFGPVRLVSPVIPLSDDDAEVSYARWFWTEFGAADTLLVEMSRDDGAHWTTVETVDSIATWTEHRFRLSDFPNVDGPTLRLRFSTADLPSDSLTEAAIDDVRVEAILCSVASADADGDGDVDLGDASAWHDCLSGPNGLPSAAECFRLDRNQNLRVDLFDYQALLNQFGP